VKLELVELSDSDCDERGGKTIVGNGRFRAVCMKTVLQYVTYSTDDPTAAFLWVRLGCKVATSSSSTCGVGQRWRYGQRPAAPERLRPIDPTPVPD
jgi:hypothetical protein